jgi:hypothetical protein
MAVPVQNKTPLTDPPGVHFEVASFGKRVDPRVTVRTHRQPTCSADILG